MQGTAALLGNESKQLPAQSRVQTGLLLLNMKIFRTELALEMTNRTHHVFFSYARAGNGEDNNQFITRFHDLLCKEHQAVTGRELKSLFDTKAISEAEHWKTRLGQGLRDREYIVLWLILSRYKNLSIQRKRHRYRGISANGRV